MERVFLDKLNQLNHEISDIKRQLKPGDLEMKYVLTCVDTPGRSRLIYSKKYFGMNLSEGFQ